MKEFKVTKPYLVFAKHGGSKKMTFLKEGERFNELALYPQVQDAMFFGEAYPIATAEANVKAKHADWKHLHWEKQVTNWGIKMIEATKDEFKEKKEEWK
jgi:magnesium-dependent phosphatase 1